jgi:hypothetical protein
MKDQFLKLAGVKSEKEFYKKFPTEEAFMAKYGKQVKKLIGGGEMAAMNKLAGSNPVGAVLQSAGDIVGGIQQMKDEKQQMLGAQQMQGVSNVALQASMTKPEQVKRRYATPPINTGEEFFPVFGTGTNALSAKNGAEIANTFAPNTIYTDLEEAQFGINLPEFKTFPDFLKNPMKQGTGKEVSDIYDFAQKGGGDALTQMTAGLGSPKGQGVSGAGKVGKGIGTAAGSIFFGPVGGMVGGAIGQLAGNLLDQKAEKTEKAKKATDRNMEMMAMNQGAQALQRQNYSYMEHGGFVNPQVATSLEGIPMKRLFAPDPTMDTLRAGGHLKSYTPPSERAMYTGREQFAMGGNLRTHWGGGLKDLSYNPFGGPTVKAIGNSHDESDKYGRTGIGLSVGDTGNSLLQDYAEFGTKTAENKAMVEVEEEPIIMKENPDGSESAVVFGALKFPKNFAKGINKPEWGNRTFKKIVEDDLVKKENKLAKQQSKALQLLESDDLLKQKTGEVTMKAVEDGFVKTFKDKNFLADFQDGMNKADEAGFDIKEFEKTGELKQAKMGAKITIAKDGFTIDQQKKAKELYDQGVKSGDMSAFQKYAEEIAPDLVKQSIDKYGLPAAGKFRDTKKGKRTDEVYAGITNPTSMIPTEPGMPSDFSVDVSGLKKPGTEREMIDYFKSQVPGLPRPFDTEGQEGKFDWMTLANQILPYVRPTDAESLDPRQLAGEMYALSTNQVMPVDAQLFQPQLSTPYDISLQDQLNANQSDYRAAQRMMGYNPAAQAMLNAQKYKSNQQVLGEQFRMNQAMKDQTYRENRSLLDQANLQNLQILDQQYGRQQQALSNTKATTQAALNSISAKYMQNQAENRTLQTYENLYNYRFDPRFRATNMNPLAQWTTESTGPTSSQMQEMFREYEKQNPEKFKKGSDYRKNGGLVKAIKSM